MASKLSSIGRNPSQSNGTVVILLLNAVASEIMHGPTGWVSPGWHGCCPLQRNMEISPIQTSTLRSQCAGFRGAHYEFVSVYNGLYQVQQLWSLADLSETCDQTNIRIETWNQFPQHFPRNPSESKNRPPQKMFATQAQFPRRTRRASTAQGLEPPPPNGWRSAQRQRESPDFPADRSPRGWFPSEKEAKPFYWVVLQFVS